MLERVSGQSKKVSRRLVGLRILGLHVSVCRFGVFEPFVVQAASGKTSAPVPVIVAMTFMPKGGRVGGMIQAPAAKQYRGNQLDARVVLLLVLRIWCGGDTSVFTAWPFWL